MILICVEKAEFPCVENHVEVENVVSFEFATFSQLMSKEVGMMTRLTKVDWINLLISVNEFIENYFSCKN